MAAVIKLSDKLVVEAHRYAKIYNRSAPKQIEHWSKLGRLVEENPDLPYNFIKDIFLSLEEIEENKLEEYKFSGPKK